MQIPYDPALDDFWEKARTIPGFPQGEDIPLRTMLFESGAAFQLSRVLDSIRPGGDRRLLLVMDNTYMVRAGEDLKQVVSRSLRERGWQVEELVLTPHAGDQVHTDMVQIDRVKQALNPAVVVLSVGSGVVTDVTKHACFLFDQERGTHLPYAAFQTANSVSAFTSNMAPVFMDGVKRTLPSRYPDALVCDLETLADAPYEMTAGGVGDLLAAFSALADWRLACHLGMDTTCTRLPEALMGPLDALLLENAQAIRERSLPGMAILAKLISLGGLVMSLAHATTPMSGYEHVISHILDLQNELRHEPLSQHGSQVALSCVLVLGAYREFLDGFAPSNLNLQDCFPDAGEMQTHVLEQFRQIDPSGKAGAECWSDYRQKLDLWHANRGKVTQFAADWLAVKQELAGVLCPPERLLEILRQVNAPLQFSQLQPPVSEARARFAFLNAPLMRKRLTLGDLLIFFNWDREALWRRLWQETPG